MSTKATGNKNTLPLLIVLPLNMVSAVGKNFTQIACRINKDSSTISKEIRRHLFGFLIFKTKPSGSAQNASIFRTVKQHICGNQTCNSLCWKCRLSAVPCIVLTLLPDSAKS